MSANPTRPTSHVALRLPLVHDYLQSNASSFEDISKNGFLDELSRTGNFLEPWQVIMEIGVVSSYNYNLLIQELIDFQHCGDKALARTLIKLAEYHSGLDDATGRIVASAFECNKNGDMNLLNKDPGDKKNYCVLSIDNISRAFREIFSHYNWMKVFETIEELEDNITLNPKQFKTFISLFTELKPKNIAFPLNVVFEKGVWASPTLHLSFIVNCLDLYLNKSEKSINFDKLQRRVAKTPEF